MRNCSDPLLQFQTNRKDCQKASFDHLTSNSLLNLFQSAYTKFNSTETTLLSLHDHLSNAISIQQVFCLCLLDLSAAFDTLDHSILLHRLSTWFGISCFTTMVHFISFIPHIYCRNPSTQFSFIPSYLRSSTRLRTRPSSFQSLYHSS